ncbi:MAG: trypsin-like peptidase domain-containing protein [Actinomycetota bacterium]
MDQSLESNVPDEFEALAKIQEKATDDLMDRANVVGVGLGLKSTGGEETDQRCITVFVSAKLDSDLLDRQDRVPKKISDVPTDVVEIGELMAGDAWSPGSTAVLDDAPPETSTTGIQRLSARVRPVLGGFSVGHPRVTAGTIATGCYDLRTMPGIPARYYILSNNHVLANSNDASVGDPILQPGVADGGRYPADVIGQLSRWIPIRFHEGGEHPCNYVDAAVAEVPFHQVDRRVYWVGTIKSLYSAPKPGDIVQKTGRTTNFTTGRVQSVNATVDVNYGRGRTARFCRQILTTNMSAGGDSGSVVTDRSERGVGLLFAGSSRVTVMNHLNYVQALLGVRISES